MRLAVTGNRKSCPGLDVLRGLDLAVAAGEVVAIRGQSVDDEEATGRSAAATARLRATRIGFVFQAFHLLPEFTAREYALIAARTARQPRRRGCAHLVRR